MTIYLPKHALTYVSVPKCGCTSLKHFFFQISNGFEFRRFRLNGHSYYIHQFAKSVAFDALQKKQMRGHRKIAVVRDPVDRVVSCYANKVVDERLLERPGSAAFLEERDMPSMPTVGQFIQDLPLYQNAAPGIRHHSQPLSHFLGRDPAYFDRLFSLRELPDLCDYVRAIVGDVPDLRHSQKSRSRAAAAELTEADRQRVDEMFAEDREIFGAFF
ncbi:sulfotransferase family 2 domain-containing protein [Tropicimonas marinistellae]|uniref:sulfotransferase family 2 domain-containing protein n=1 Tax=Tropicimonas marinistellae TaxID=1739787 RepID=UPI0008359821|nr:sulfotransferase family 2 domain-containing protein [Tropicimonas marinistellae]